MPTERDALKFFEPLAVNGKRAEIEMAWLVPSEDLILHGTKVQINGKPHLRLTASAKPETKDKWRWYRLTREELPAALMAAVEEMESPAGLVQHMAEQEPIVCCAALRKSTSPPVLEVCAVLNEAKAEGAFVSTQQIGVVPPDLSNKPVRGPSCSDRGVRTCLRSPHGMRPTVRGIP
jgi:hypothetical protein